MNEWYLIETLVPDEASVVAVDGVRKDWTSVKRLSPAADVQVELIIAHVREARSIFQVVARSKKKPGAAWRIKAIPVLGPSDEVHGVQLWIGEPDVTVRSPRICSAVTFLRDEFVIQQTWESSAMSGIMPGAFDPIGTPVEYINRAATFGEESEFLDMAANPDPGRKLDTQFAVKHETGPMMQWQAVIRTYPDPDQRGWRVLFQDVSDVYPPAAPTLAQLAMTEGLANSGYHVGLFDLVSGTLAAWISLPAVWLQWENTDHFGPVLHPEDLPAFHEARTRLLGGENAVVMSVRLRSIEDDFVETNVRISSYKPANVPDDGYLAIVQISASQDANTF